MNIMNDAELKALELLCRREGMTSNEDRLFTELKRRVSSWRTMAFLVTGLFCGFAGVLAIVVTHVS